MFLRNVLRVPIIYDSFQFLIGNKKRHRILKKEYIGDVSGKNVLELGCGTCDLLEYFEDCNYVGIDMDPNYIEKAKKRYAKREHTSFECMDLNDYAKKCNEKYDLILMTGVIHHISDKEVENCFSLIKQMLNEGGRFFSFDAVYVDGMSNFERFLADKDRGQYVRREEEYVKLHKKYWDNVHYECRNDTMLLPFNIIIFVNSNENRVC